MTDYSIDYTTALKTINEIKTAFTYPIFIPSLGKEVRFIQMTTAQQKAFVKISMLNTSAQDAAFSNAAYSLIKETCTEAIDVDALTILDRLVICLMIRIMSVGNTLKISVGPDNLNESEEAQPNSNGETFSLNIDLVALYNKIISEYAKINTSEQVISIPENPISVVIAVPTIKDEIKINTMLDEFGSTPKNDPNNTTYADIFSKTFYAELIKYIKKVIIKNESTNETSTVDFTVLTPKQKMDIYLSIPSNVTTAAMIKINELVSDINKLTMFDINHKNKQYRYNIEVLNSDFFIAL